MFFYFGYGGGGWHQIIKVGSTFDSIAFTMIVSYLSSQSDILAKLPALTEYFIG